MASNKIEQVIFDEMGITEQQWEASMEINIQKYMSSVDTSTGDDFTAECLAVVNAEKELTVLFCRVFPKIVKKISDSTDMVFCVYQNRRIVHLALHHRSEWVRKKNRNRILKWIKRGCKV